MTHYVSISPALSSSLSEFTLCASVYTNSEQLTSTEAGHWLFNYGVLDGSNFQDKLGLSVGVGFVGYKVVSSSSFKKETVRMI